MAKGEKRGWKSLVPTPWLIGKVFIVLVIIKIINRYVVYDKLPANVTRIWPAF
jgi:hypothetical protein